MDWYRDGTLFVDAHWLGLFVISVVYAIRVTKKDYSARSNLPNARRVRFVGSYPAALGVLCRVTFVVWATWALQISLIDEGVYALADAGEVAAPQHNPHRLGPLLGEGTPQLVEVLQIGGEGREGTQSKRSLSWDNTLVAGERHKGTQRRHRLPQDGLGGRLVGGSVTGSVTGLR